MFLRVRRRTNAVRLGRSTQDGRCTGNAARGKYGDNRKLPSLRCARAYLDLARSASPRPRTCTLSRLRCFSRVVLCSVSVLVGVDMAHGQGAMMPAHSEPYRVDSGLLDNPRDEATVVFEETIDFGGLSSWSQVIFSGARLPSGSLIRITSLRDGESQSLDADLLRDWRNASALLNGDSLLVQLIAGPHTTGNLMRIDEIMVGDEPIAQDGGRDICGVDDQRIPSGWDAAGRLIVKFDGPTLYCVCTGFIIDTPGGNDKCHLSAGHCFHLRCTDPPEPGVWSSAQLQFDVPLSNANCMGNEPDMNDHFPVTDLMASSNNGIGDDWAVFRCGLNSNGKTTFEARQAAFPPADAVPTSGLVLVVGYGIDGNEDAMGGSNAACTCTGSDLTGRWNNIQQVDQGAITNNSPIEHEADMCSGDSGGPIFLLPPPHQVVGINTHHGCDGGGTNKGTPITLQALQDAIAVCKEEIIPTLSEWGLTVMTVLGLTLGTVVFGRRRRTAAA